jgi:hypothetical protein
MANQAPQKSGFEKWRDGINPASGNAEWNRWDCEIQMAVNDYNRHLSGTSGYRPLDWQLIKALLWVETGGQSHEWKKKPMQIGVAGDPGLTSLLSGKEGGNLILPPNIRGRLTIASARTIPEYNIRAGIGYLLMRMAIFETRTVVDADSKVYETAVKAGDSLEKVAKDKGSTVEILKKLNPTANVLRPGRSLRYQEASTQLAIASWRHISTAANAQRYNGGRDPNYAVKLDYALELVRKENKALCTQ